MYRSGFVFKKAVILFIFCTFACSIFALDLRIKILDKDLLTPLEGVRVESDNMLPVITNGNGIAVVTFTNSAASVRFRVSMLGYQSTSFWAKAGEIDRTILLELGNTFEGKDLVVEKQRFDVQTSQAGISYSSNKEEIRATAEIGIVEDLINNIKLLPGVGLTGGWSGSPSIRGGSPSETRAILDGVNVLYPYHLGGAFSIFNPNMIQSAKLSTGIVSAAYGQVGSALLEVESRVPESDEVEYITGLSTTGIDGWLLAPIGQKAGLLLGGKTTWLETAFALSGQATNFDVVPYIRDAYARLWWKPSPDVSWAFNAFLGTDGVAEHLNTVIGSTPSLINYAYKNLFNLASLSFRGLLSSQSAIGIEAAWNWLSQDVSYSSINTNDLKFSADKDNKNLQAKAFLDLEPVKEQIISIGIDADYKLSNTNENRTLILPGNPETLLLGIQAHDISTLNSSAYALLKFNLASSLFKGELGVRLEQITLWNRDLNLSSTISVSPRISVLFTPFRNVGVLNSLSFTGGSGLLAQNSTEIELLEKKYNPNSQTISPTRLWFNALGVEAQFQEDWNLSIEAYYKYYFDRLYITLNSFYEPSRVGIHNDGIGYSIGFDVMIQKKESRYWNGWIVYSYNDAKYINPTHADYPEQTTATQDPINITYYPSWHRFHTLKFVSNWKPSADFSILLTASIASGTPKLIKNKLITYTPENTAISISSLQDVYSDSLRNNFYYPLEIKVSWNGYFPASKVGWNFYIGIEDILSFLNAANLADLNPTAGSDGFNNDSLSINPGFPFPSIGFKISY